MTMLRHWIAASIFLALSFGTSLFFIKVAGASDPSVQWKRSCSVGTYQNPVTSITEPEPEPNGRCLPCSQCGPGLYVAHPCHSTRDTVCDSCHTYRGPHNRDFRRRCRLLSNSDDVTRPIIGRHTMTSSGSANLNPGTPDIGYDDNNRTMLTESKSNAGVNDFSVGSAKSYQPDESRSRKFISDERLVHVNSTAGLPAVPSGEDWWLRLVMNAVSVPLCAALCYFAFYFYRLKRTPIIGYKVISKIEDV